MCGHVALQLRPVGEGVAAEGAGEVFLVLLMPVLDVLLQRSQALVAPVAVGAGQQLGKGIWRSRWQVCNGEGWRRRGAGAGMGGQKVSESMAANGLAAQKSSGSNLCNLLRMGATDPAWHTHTHTHIYHRQRTITFHHFRFLCFRTCFDCVDFLRDAKKKVQNQRSLPHLCPNRPFVSPSWLWSSWLQQQSWDLSDSALLFFFLLFSFGDLERCTI